jgi:SAM-dependent methyltransferase
MSRITPVASIKDIDTRLKDTDALIKAIPVLNSGSLLRISMSDYRNWGIRVDGNNSDYLKSEARAAYMIEWKETGDNINALVAMGSKLAGLSDVNANMCKRIGEIVASNYKPSVVLDLGTGTGHPSFEVYTALQAKGIKASKKDTLFLNDPSKQRLTIANATITGMPFWGGEELRVLAGVSQDLRLLQNMDKESVNIIISNAAIHHHSDNDHLHAANEVLVPKGWFVNGDWHESMWQQPERAYWMFAALKEDQLGNREIADSIVKYVKSDPSLNDYMELTKTYHERQELTAYRRYFNLDMFDLAGAFSAITNSQCLANAGIMQFWRSVNTKFAEVHETAPIQIFEAHETVSQRIANMTNAGFAVISCEPVETGYGELATVMTSVKLRK